MPDYFQDIDTQPHLTPVTELYNESAETVGVPHVTVNKQLKG